MKDYIEQFDEKFKTANILHFSEGFEPVWVNKEEVLTFAKDFIRTALQDQQEQIISDLLKAVGDIKVHTDTNPAYVIDLVEDLLEDRLIAEKGVE